MLELCSILAINVNELLSGEKISMQEYQNKAETNLLELQKENGEQTKRLLMLETVMGLLVTISFLTLIFVASLITMPTMVRILLILIGLVIFIIGISYCLLIEQKAGYYECAKCHYRYIPTYKQVLWAMHTGRSRYMKCPKCGSRSWHKKVLTK
jgi:DNA-directed RNA polymerase subunit RPC12/RpoP